MSLGLLHLVCLPFGLAAAAAASSSTAEWPNEKRSSEIYLSKFQDTFP